MPVTCEETIERMCGGEGRGEREIYFFLLRKEKEAFARLGFRFLFFALFFLFSLNNNKKQPK